MMQSIKTLWKKHQMGKRLIATYILVGVLSLSLPKVSYAQQTEPSIRDKVFIETVTHLSTAMQYINLILWPILILSGDLLDSSIFLDVPLVKTDQYLDNPQTAEKIGTMEDRLLSVWVQIRNIVNIIFVVILLFVALYNVLGRTEGEFALKSALPKIAIGLIAINFSFLICKVVLDVTNVLTTAVIALPINSLKDNFDETKKEISESLCYYAESQDVEPDPIPADQIEAWGLGAICKLTSDGKETTGEFKPDFEESFLAKADHKNLAFIITAQIAKLAQLKYVSTQITVAAETAIEEDLLRLLLEILTNLIILILYIVSIIALFVVLIARLVVLWALIALSPLLILFMSIPQLKQQMEEFDFQKLFIQHSIAPILIVGSMSIGYILLASMASEDTTIVFPNDALNQSVSTFGLPFAAFNTMPNFLATIAGVAVIFMGVFGAASKTAAKTVTDGLRNMTTAGAKLLAKTPLYWIKIPVKKQAAGEKQEKLSLGAALTAAQMAGPALARSHQARGMAELQEKTPDIYRMLTAGGIDKWTTFKSSVNDQNYVQRNLVDVLTNFRLTTQQDHAVLEKAFATLGASAYTGNNVLELNNYLSQNSTTLNTKIPGFSQDTVDKINNFQRGGSSTGEQAAAPITGGQSAGGGG